MKQRKVPFCLIYPENRKKCDYFYFIATTALHPSRHHHTAIMMMNNDTKASTTSTNTTTISLLDPEGLEPSPSTRMDLSPKSDKKRPSQQYLKKKQRQPLLSESSMRELRSSMRLSLPEESKELNWLLMVFDPEVSNVSAEFDD